MMRNYRVFAEAFTNCEIDAATFSHRDHLGVAFELIRTHEFLDAVAKYSSCLKTIAARAGASEKFNTTITIAFLSILSERMEAAEYSSFEEFIGDNNDLLSGDLLARWYSKERLGSDSARSSFLMPDLQA